MLKPRRKIIIGILLIMCMCIFLPLMILRNDDAGEEYIQSDDPDTLGRSESQLQSILDTLGTLEWKLGEVYDNFYSQAQAKADLTAFAMKQAVQKHGDGAISMVGEGGVVKISNGSVRIPQGFRTGITKYASQITGEKGRLIYDTNAFDGERKDILVYSQISGPYYYVEIINGNTLLSYVDENADYMAVLEGIEEAYSMEMYLICPDPENSRFFFNQPGNLVYSIDVYTDMRVYEIDRRSINAEDVGLPSDRAALLALDGTMEQDKESGSRYQYMVREVDGLDSILVLRMDATQLIRGGNEQAVSLIILMIALSLVFLVWITSAYGLMTSGKLTAENKKKYSPARLRLITVSYGILTTILVLAFSIYVSSLTNIHQEIEESSSILEVLDFRLDRVDDDEDSLDKARKKLHMEYGSRAALMIDQHPALNNKEDLAVINSIIGSKFLILFDREGKEISSSADYIHMELGDDQAENPTSTADFRKILHGVPGIAHDTVKDEVIGEELDMVGVRTIDRETGQYGVLLLAFEPSNKEIEKNNAINEIMESLIPAGEFCFIVDLPTKKVKYVTSNDYIETDMTAAQVGLKESALKGSITDFITISGVRHFCVSSLDTENKEIRYIMTRNDYLLGNSFQTGLLYAIGYAILFVILSAYLLHGYTNETVQKLEDATAEAEQKPAQDGQKTVETAQDSAQDGKKTVKAAQDSTKAGKENSDLFGQEKRWRKSIAHWFRTSSPEQKAGLVMQCFLLAGMLGMVLRIPVLHDSQWQNELITYILEGRWNRGLNLFALTASILLGVSLVLGLMFVRFIMATIGSMLSPRGQTICKMLSNMFNYVGVLVFLYFALSYIGVDTNAILASVGVLGIGLSMGARDLIADIFAGVSTIFEGEYQVGDIVNINGYRGTVEEIGVRSTRVVGRGGNERIFSNKDINSVINLTKMNSWVAITIRVDVKYPLQDVEEILAQKLPEIGANCKYIIHGPIYKGVLSVETGFAVLSIIAECNEDNYNKVERILYREVLLALREKDVPVK